MIAATVFKLHVHLLYKYINGITFHLFVNDLVLIFASSLEKKFSKNTHEVEILAAREMIQLENFPIDYLRPVNVENTKSMLVHSIVSYQWQDIALVRKFRYLGVNVTVKLGWSSYLNDPFKAIRKIYDAVKIIFRCVGRRNVKIRRRIFLLPMIILHMVLFHQQSRGTNRTCLL